MNDPSVQASRQVFGEYATLDHPFLPGDPWSALQVKLFRWQSRNFGNVSEKDAALGAAEEIGELCHAILKHSQEIRGMTDPEEYRDACGDAIADCVIYLMQLSTMLRLDFGALIFGVADQVMARNWTENKKDGAT